MDEDCLFFNVFCVMNFKYLKLLVMVWFYGGGLYYGFGNEYLGFVCGYGVIVVMVNYCFGLLGYFNFFGLDIKGNYGMFDQVVVLKWV